ncbi:MAG: molybdopterin-guanine dinucleotide biosynthesis protein B [Promethearchaeota archaeon]
MQKVLLPPTLSIFGFKDSGKTLVATYVIEHFTSQNLRVLAIKHVGEPSFTLDHPKTDSHRLTQSGAAAVILHSDASTSLLCSHPASSLKELIHLGTSSIQADIVVLEGFRSWTQHNEQIAKIICIKEQEEIKELAEGLRGQLLATCSLKSGIQGTLHIPDKFPELLIRLDYWLGTAHPISEIE